MQLYLKDMYIDGVRWCDTWVYRTKTKAMKAFDDHVRNWAPQYGDVEVYEEYGIPSKYLQPGNVRKYARCTNGRGGVIELVLKVQCTED